MTWRFFRFNAVGVAGFALQLAVLALLVHLRVHYLIATALAVEAAVLHNFFWHERWTWGDRQIPHGRPGRLWRFHALNGLVSLAGNIVLMRLLVGTFGLPAVPANLLAVLACSVVNYFASDRVVFDSGSRIGDSGRAISDSGSAIREERFEWRSGASARRT